MMASIDAPIGASVVDYIQRSSSSCSNGAVEQEQQSPPPPDASNGRSSLEDESSSSCSLKQQPCLIPCHDNQSINYLLCGPSQSGRTGLVMNMAHSLACCSCSCGCSSDGECTGSIARSCQCTAVTILMPLTNHDKQENFPLYCHAAESSSRSPPQDFYGQLRALQQQQQQPLSPHHHCIKQTTNASSSSWNKSALRRIQVHRMASVRDVIDYLLTIPAMPPNKQPLKGIVVEDLDRFATIGKNNNNDSNETNDELSTEALMTMTQLLAILADTANTLRHRLSAKKTSSSSSFSVMATLGEKVPWNVHRLWSNWFPTCLKIRTFPSSSTWKNVQLEEDESVEALYALEQTQAFVGGIGGEVPPVECVATYAIGSHSNGLSRIVWKPGNM